MHLLYNSAFKDWNNVAVMHQDDAWGKGYVTQMELEFRRSILHTATEAAEEDALPRTLLLFPFTKADDGSVARALDAVHDSSYSAIVVVVNFASTRTTFANLLEVYAWPHTAHPALAPPPAVLRSPPSLFIRRCCPADGCVESQECTHAHC